MARQRRSRPGNSTPVEAITHADKRQNLPLSGEEAREFVTTEMEQPIPLRYPRDPSLDPQLVWRGKDELDGEDLVAEAPAIYIQEKIDPRVLVENLRQMSSRRASEPELTLFDDFDGLPPLDLVDFYRHEANWSNRMILGDSLNVMASLAEREGLRGQVQMIYMDPPYGIKFGSNWQLSARSRDVRDGRIEDVSREVEQIKAFRDTWELRIHSYLTYLRDRLSVARDLLAPSGSIFVQIGEENVHLVRSVLDEVFGSDNFVSLITFVTTSGFTQEMALPRNGDYLLWYGRSVQDGPLKVRKLWAESRERQGYRWLLLPDGSHRGMTQREVEGVDRIPVGARVYKPGDLQSQGRSGAAQPFEYEGRRYEPGPNSHWKANYPQGMQRLTWAGRIHVARNSIQYRRFEDDFGYQIRTNLWSDTGTGNFTEDKLYVVQTNTKVVERCVLLATDPGDLVVDPTCGSGTTAVVAEQWGRRWITIDTSRVALALARQRLMTARFPYYLLSDSSEGRAKEAEIAREVLPPPAVEPRRNVRDGFVYKRVGHITLESIANNPDIREGMTAEQLEAAITRHAATEVLYDDPYEDARRVRVAGPFTMETLSPHRAAAVDPTLMGAEVDGQIAEAEGVFEEMIRENLKASGIQNGRRSERLTFDAVERYASPHIQFLGDRGEQAAGGPRRVGISLGPQYGTVGPPFIKDAAREAIRAEGIDLLCVLGFAFDPSVLGTGDGYVASDEGFAEVAAERRLGRIPVLLVRMNADLVMGKDLRKAPNANLFTVFGEPDVDVVREGDVLRVIVRGVDAYDPNTGEMRSRSTDRIALWMIDTAYNGESFFVRHCYFTGRNDPYGKLKRALRAEINEDAWQALYRTESLPFPLPDTGRIAVKVINDYGDEVVKVIAV